METVHHAGSETELRMQHTARGEFYECGSFVDPRARGTLEESPEQTQNYDACRRYSGGVTRTENLTLCYRVTPVRPPAGDV